MSQSFRFFCSSLMCLLTGLACADAIDRTKSSETSDTSSVSAQSLQSVAEGSFASLDRNQDGRLSRSEAGFDRLLSQTFALIDTDGDGFVTPEEFAAAQQSSTALSQR